MYKDVLDLFFFKLFHNVISETTVSRDDDMSLCWLTAFPSLSSLSSLKGNLDSCRTQPSGYIYIPSLSLFYTALSSEKFPPFCFPTIFGLGVLDTTTFCRSANWLAAITSFLKLFFLCCLHIFLGIVFFGELGHIVVSGFAYFSIWSFCVTIFLLILMISLVSVCYCCRKLSLYSLFVFVSSGPKRKKK